LKAGALSDSDAIDAALGTGQVISDALLADDGADLQLSGATPAITVGGTPALGDLIVFEAYRNVSGTDDMTEDAWLFEVVIQYQTSSTAVVGW
jgi:predicted porin